MDGVSSQGFDPEIPVLSAVSLMGSDRSVESVPCMPLLKFHTATLSREMDFSFSAERGSSYASTVVYWSLPGSCQSYSGMKC